MDPLTLAKYNALDHYSQAELERLNNSVLDILIDCQHKGWSGKLQSAVVSPLDENQEPWIEGDSPAPAGFAVTLMTKDGREHTAYRDITGCDSLLCQVKEQYAATVEALDALLPLA